MNDELMTTREVSEMMSTPMSTLRWWRHQGGGPRSFVIGKRKVVYKKSDVIAYIEDHYRRST